MAARATTSTTYPTATVARTDQARSGCGGLGGSAVAAGSAASNRGPGRGSTAAAGGPPSVAMLAVYPKSSIGRWSGPVPAGTEVILLVVASVLAVGAIVGVAAYAAVRRWPEATVAAPHLSTEPVVTEVHARPRLARFLRSRADPATATGLALTVAVALVLVGATAVGVLLAMVRTSTGLARYDDWFARFGADHATSGS